METINTNKSNVDKSNANITEYAGRIYAFAHHRPHRHHIAISQNKQDNNHNQYEAENRLILNSLKRLIDKSEMHVNSSNNKNNNSNNNNNALVVYEQKRKRNRKPKMVEYEELGYGVVNVNGENIDLKYLACVADDAFGNELKKLTMGMTDEKDLLGFMNGLEGRWGSRRKRRKIVDASLLVNKVLPGDWKVQLSLRPRVRASQLPSLYCRQFLSPSDVQFSSCKDVAFYLKSQFMTNDANPVKERIVMQREFGCQVDLADIIASQNEPKSIPQNGEGSSFQEPLMVEDNTHSVTESGHGTREVEDNVEGLGVINVDGEDINLNYLVHNADSTFMTILNGMTRGMSEEEEFLGFLTRLHGQWGSNRRRRKFVSATTFLKVLPVHWRVQLSLRPRQRQPSLYFRKFVSPAGEEFNTCKEVAYHLKSQHETNTDPPKEGEMLQIENYDSQVDLLTVKRKAPAPHVLLLNKDTVKRHPELKYIPVMGEGSSSLPGPTTRLKMRCKWCRDFYHEPTHPQTLYDFTCPNCKDKAYSKLNNDLSKLT